MIKKFFGVDFKFEKYSALTGETVVEYTEMHNTEDPFQVKINVMGINFAGTLKNPIAGEKDIYEFARFISEVIEHERNLKPQIIVGKQ